MKRILTIIVAFAVFAAFQPSSTAQDLKGLVKKAAENVMPQKEADAKSQGNAAGVALKELYAQYQADGKLSVTNRKNIKNMSVLATNVQGLKGQSNKSTFYKEFAAGKVSTATIEVTKETISTSFTPEISDWVADNDLNFSQEDTPVELPEETKSCKLIIKVNKSIEWYDKYIYAWDSNETKLTGEWPGTKAEWDKEDGEYYVYYHIFDASLDGKTFNYIINGNGAGQTKDLTVTLSGAETTVTIEKSDVQ